MLLRQNSKPKSSFGTGSNCAGSPTPLICTPVEHKYSSGIAGQLLPLLSYAVLFFRPLSLPRSFFLLPLTPFCSAFASTMRRVFLIFPLVFGCPTSHPAILTCLESTSFTSKSQVIFQFFVYFFGRLKAECRQRLKGGQFRLFRPVLKLQFDPYALFHPHSGIMLRRLWTLWTGGHCYLGAPLSWAMAWQAACFCVLYSLRLGISLVQIGIELMPQHWFKNGMPLCQAPLAMKVNLDENMPASAATVSAEAGHGIERRCILRTSQAHRTSK